jgi:hypothetical protein
MYRNYFEKCFPSLSGSEISLIENKFQISFTKELKEHYLFCNGGRPKRKCWEENGWEPVCLKSFLPIIPEGRSEDEFGLSNNLQAALTGLLLDGPHIPQEFIPFAEDWGGNYFCQDMDSGYVYFFSMDCGDDFERGKRYLTKTLTDFINNLVEEM